VLHRLLDDVPMQKGAIVALASFPHAATPPALLAAYRGLSDASRQAAIAALVSRPDWTISLLDAIAAGTVPRGRGDQGWSSPDPVSPRPP